MADAKVKSPWELADVTKAEAYYFNGHLILIVSGDKPTPCYKVRIERSPLTVEPPAFIVEWRHTGGICPDVVTPYRWSQVFNIGVYRPKINVISAGGTKSVPVKKLPVVQAGAAAAKKAKPRTATGYSDTFSFEGAFEDAIQQLPPLYPDELQNFVVTETGAMIGGIAGLHQLYVTVRVD